MRNKQEREDEKIAELEWAHAEELNILKAQHKIQVQDTAVHHDQELQQLRGEAESRFERAKAEHESDTQAQYNTEQNKYIHHAQQEHQSIIGGRDQEIVRLQNILATEQSAKETAQAQLEAYKMEAEGVVAEKDQRIAQLERQQSELEASNRALAAETSMLKDADVVSRKEYDDVRNSLHEAKRDIQFVHDEVSATTTDGEDDIMIDGNEPKDVAQLCLEVVTKMHRDCEEHDIYSAKAKEEIREKDERIAGLEKALRERETDPYHLGGYQSFYDPLLIGGGTEVCDAEEIEQDATEAPTVPATISSVLSNVPSLSTPAQLDGGEMSVAAPASLPSPESLASSIGEDSTSSDPFSSPTTASTRQPRGTMRDLGKPKRQAIQAKPSILAAKGSGVRKSTKQKTLENQAVAKILHKNVHKRGEAHKVSQKPESEREQQLKRLTSSLVASSQSIYDIATAQQKRKEVLNTSQRHLDTIISAYTALFAKVKELEVDVHGHEILTEGILDTSFFGLGLQRSAGPEEPGDDQDA